MATFNVSNSAQLMSAARSAGGGDRIVLASGTYGALDLGGTGRNGLDYGGGVTFASANPGSPAVIKSLNVQSMSNVTFEGLKFDGGGSGRAFQVNASSNITFNNTTFEGERSGGYGFGNGLTVTKSSQITVRNSEFSDFKRGMEFRGVNGLDVVGNDVHDISGDAMAYAEVRNVLIQGNNLHDMRGDPRSGYHKDLIQFWTTGTKSPTTDVVIRGNTLESNDGSSQSIFMGNSAAAGNKSLFWQDILIEKNFIKAGHFHGITVGETNGLVIRDNVVLHDPGASKGTQINIPRITVDDASTNVTVTGNTAHEVPGKSGGSWNVSNNKIVSKGFQTGGPQAGPGPDRDSGGGAAPDKASGGATQIDMADLLNPQSRAFYADFAREAELTLRNGRGDGGDDLVLVSGSSAHAGGGDNILVGNGGRNMLHSGPGDNVLTGLGGPDQFVFAGSNARADKTDVVLDLDFREGDKIVLNGFGRNTFDDDRGGNPLAVRGDGRAVVLDSAADVRELVSASRAVTLERKGGDPVLDIEQNGRNYEIRLDGFDL